jgi:hypothetical protein
MAAYKVGSTQMFDFRQRRQQLTLCLARIIDYRACVR